MELRTDRFKLKEFFPEKAALYAERLKLRADEIEFVRKGIPINPRDISILEGERAAIRLITTPNLDRDNEILIPDGADLEDFRQNPIVLYAHDSKGLPVGKDIWISVLTKGILTKTVYATHQFAEDVFGCVKGGFLNASSCGFIPVEYVDRTDSRNFNSWQNILEQKYGISRDESGKARRIYTKWILLEHSDVPVPSNVQSLNLAVSKHSLIINSDRLRKDLEITIEPGDRRQRETEKLQRQIHAAVTSMPKPGGIRAEIQRTIEDIRKLNGRLEGMQKLRTTVAKPDRQIIVDKEIPSSPEEIKSLVIKMIGTMNIGPIVADAVKIELAKIRGRLL